MEWPRLFYRLSSSRFITNALTFNQISNKHDKDAEPSELGWVLFYRVYSAY